MKFSASPFSFALGVARPSRSAQWFPAQDAVQLPLLEFEFSIHNHVIHAFRDFRRFGVRGFVDAQASTSLYEWLVRGTLTVRRERSALEILETIQTFAGACGVHTTDRRATFRRRRGTTKSTAASGRR